MVYPRKFNFFYTALFFLLLSFVLVPTQITYAQCGSGFFSAPCPTNTVGSGGAQGAVGSDGTQDGGGGVGLQNPLKFNTVAEFVNAILNIVVAIGSPIVLFFLIYAGFLFVTARGNETRLDTAKRVFLWTVIGGIVLLGAQALSAVIQNTISQISGR